MKTLLPLLLVFGSLAVKAETLPECADDSPKPCVVKESKENDYLVSMMLQNKKGMKKVLATGEYGLQIDGLEDNPVTIIVLEDSYSETPDGELWKTKIEYRVRLSDDEGTDAGNGAYLWRVISTTEADGYTSYTKFTNTLKKIPLR